MPDPILRTLGNALTYLQRRQDVTANNLANATTGAFKFDRLTATRLADGTLGAVETTDYSQGALHETGAGLDFGLDGAGLMALRDDKGQEVYSRGGSFVRGADGFLRNSMGDLVLGEKCPISLPLGPLTVQDDGTVIVGGSVVDRLKLVGPSGPLTKLGNGRYSAATALKSATGTHVRQGYLEDSNVNSIDAMVELISTQRSWGAGMSAVRAADDVMNVTNSLARIQ